MAAAIDGLEVTAAQVNSLLNNPVRALIVGLVVAGLTLTVWLVTGPVDPRALISVLLRFVHVISAMTWIGFVFFVNFIQMPALQEADEASWSAIFEVDCPPRVAAGFRFTSHLTVLSGALLLVSTGYLLGEWVFSSQVSMAPPRSFMLAAGALGGLLMWAFVNHAIWPSLKIVLGQTAGDAGAQARARRTVKRYARLNLVLALPVTFAMVAAAHLS
jgi:uncharacterized membrane protein